MESAETEWHHISMDCYKQMQVEAPYSLSTQMKQSLVYSKVANFTKPSSSSNAITFSSQVQQKSSPRCLTPLPPQDYAASAFSKPDLSHKSFKWRRELGSRVRQCLHPFPSLWSQLVQGSHPVQSGTHSDPCVWMDRLAAMFRAFQVKLKEGEVRCIHASLWWKR